MTKSSEALQAKCGRALRRMPAGKANTKSDEYLALVAEVWERVLQSVSKTRGDATGKAQA